MKCKVCGEEIGTGCKPMMMELCQSRYYSWLTEEEWKSIYEFMKKVYLPFMHSIFANAEERVAAERKQDNKEVYVDCGFCGLGHLTVEVLHTRIECSCGATGTYQRLGKTIDWFWRK